MLFLIKTRNTLNFLQRNLKYCPKQVKQTAYFSLVRSVMEYSGAIWDPHLQKDKDELERINRRAARFVANDYDQHSSVTAILKNYWPSLEHRRQNQRPILMYNIVHNIVAIPSTWSLIPADSRTKANHSYNYKNISTSSSQHKNSFFPRTILHWNSLNIDIAESSSLDR